MTLRPSLLTPLPPEPQGDTGADARLTAERDEIKFLVPPTHVRGLTRALDRMLPRHRFTGDGANGLPDPQHWVTTIYFDTPSRAQHRAATSGTGRDVKIRAKEYYDLHPTLAEVATDPAQIVRYQPWLWFELKRRSGTHTSKRRFRLHKRDVPVLFAGGHVAAERLAELGPDAASVDDVREIADHCRALGEPLFADCVVNYRRVPWQDGAGLLRVTLDLDVAAFVPAADLWTRTRALVRTGLGTPRPLVDAAVIEVKARGELPAWLQSALEEATATRVPMSKFLRASEAIHG